MDALTVKCPTCELAGYTTLCVCGGAGQIDVVNLGDFSDGYEIHPLMLCALDGTPVAYNDPRGNYFEHFSITPEPDDPRIACWGLYFHLREGGVVNIADFRTAQDAQEFQTLLDTVLWAVNC